MIDLKHPSDLNLYQIYSQAAKVAKKTSRAKNRDWYENVFGIRRQWHIWVDGGSAVTSAVFDVKAGKWAVGPELNELGEWLQNGGIEEGSSELSGGLGMAEREGLAKEEEGELKNALVEVLRSRELGGKVPSLGVVLHVADEFAVLEPSRDYSSNGDFEEVQALLLEDPKEVLGDSTIEPLLNTWRLLPCWGVKEGRKSMVVQLSRRRDAFFDSVRKFADENNIAVCVAGVSAPLETLRLAPLYLEWEETRGRGDIIVMVYRNFSALAVINGEGELVQLRSLAHRSGQEYPSSLGDILINTQISVGLDNPVVSILPMNGGTGQGELTKELTAFFARREPMDIGFNELDQLDVLQSIPGKRIEMLLADNAELTALVEYKVLAENTTFTGLASGWDVQDFYPVDRGELEKVPSWQDLQLRKWFGIVKSILLVAAIGLAMWGGMKVLKITATEAWQTAEIDPVAPNADMVNLTKEGKLLNYWQAIMAKRSQGWLVMQLLLELFPEDSGVVMTSCDYSIKILRAQAKRGAATKPKDVGFIREWKITGFAKPQAGRYLNDLGSNAFLKQQFAVLAEKYKADEFELDVKGRTISVTLQREQKKYPASGPLGKEGKAYTTGFTMVISQRFSVEDPLKIPIAIGK